MPYLCLLLYNKRNANSTLFFSISRTHTRTLARAQRIGVVSLRNEFKTGDGVVVDGRKNRREPKIEDGLGIGGKHQIPSQRYAQENQEASVSF